MSTPQVEDGYTRIANELFDEILAYGFTARQLKVLMSLIRKTYGYNKKADDISASQLGLLCGLARNHVTEAINDLVDRKVVAKEVGTYGLKLSVNKHYRQWISPEKGLPNTSPKSGQVLVPNWDKTSPELGEPIVPNWDTQKTTLTKDNQKTTSKDKCASQAMRERFAKFYSAYPKKRNRKDAVKAFEKLNPDETLLVEILEAVEVAKCCDDWRKEDGQFIPYPASWLNAEGWKDEYSRLEYSESELFAMARYAEIMLDPWPRVVTAPYSKTRATAIREFLEFSPDKSDMAANYFSYCFANVAYSDGLGFDWLIRKETYIKVREGAAKARVAA